MEGKQFDRLAILASSDVSHTFSLDFWAIQKTECGSDKKLENPIGIPLDAKNGAVLEPFQQATNGGRACLACHPNGPRAIVPAPGSVSVDDQEKIDRVNRMIEGYGRVTFGPFLDPRKLGPPVGKSAECTACHHHGGDMVDKKFPERSAFTGMTFANQLFHEMTGKGYFRMPTFTYRDPDMKVYNEVIARLAHLPKEKRMVYDRIYRKNAGGLAGRGGIPVFEGKTTLESIDEFFRPNRYERAARSDMNVSLIILNKMRKEGIINDEELSSASRAVTKYSLPMAKDFLKIRAPSR